MKNVTYDNLVLAFFMSVLFSQATFAANLLANPGFEAGVVSPWATAGSTTGLETTNVHTGIFAYRVGGDTGSWPNISQAVSITGSETYTFSGWVKISGKTESSAKYMFEIRWYSSSGSEVGSRTQFGAVYNNIGWTQVQTQVTAPANATSVSLRFQANKATGTGYVDDFSITGRNLAPTAVIRSDVTTGRDPLTISFDASSSSDPDNDALTYSWDFNGDGVEDSSVMKPQFVYSSDGNFTASLTVTDGEFSSTATVPIVVLVNTPPAIQAISSQTSKEGSEIRFSVVATDVDGDIPALSIENPLAGVTFTSKSNSGSNPVSSTMEVVWTPQAGQAGSHQLIIKAVDGLKSNLTATATVNVDVEVDPVVRGLIGHWRMDAAEAKGNTIFDVSGSGNHATIMGAGQLVAGQSSMGEAVALNGVDAYVVTNKPIDLQTFTISGWIQHAASQPSWRVLAQRQVGVSGDEYYLLGLLDNKSVFITNTSENGYSNINTGATVNAGAWVHLAATFDGTNYALFVNGIQQFKNVHSGSFAVDSTPLTFGAGINGTTPFDLFNGKIDDIRIYNKALTAQQIDDIITGFDRGGEQPPQAPTAAVSADVAAGISPLTVNFDASGSVDPEGDVLTYYWDFNADGVMDASGVNVQNTFSSLGDNVVVLTVSDGIFTSTATITVHVQKNAPPVLNPIGNKNIKEGSELRFTVTATDPDGWVVDLSVEPLVSPLTGSAQFIAETGEFIWMPSAGDAGVYSVTFTAKDGLDPNISVSETIAISVLAPTPPPSTVNLLINSGFEDGVATPWNVVGSTAALETTNVHTGRFAYRVGGDTNGWPNVNQAVSVVGGKTYDFSGWVKVSGENKSSPQYMIEIRWYDNSGAEVGSRNQFGLVTADINWTQFVTQDVAPATAITATLRFQANKTSGTGYMDDFSITPVGGPLPVAATPTISPNGGAILDTDFVTLTSATTDANIYYTIDGSTPSTSSTVYVGPISLASDTTVKTITAGDSYQTSAEASASFTVTPTPPPVVRGPLKYFSGFETGTVISLEGGTGEDEWFTEYGNCKTKGSDWAYYVVSDGNVMTPNDGPAPKPRSGNHAIRFELRKTDTPLVCDGTGRVRTEIQARAPLFTWGDKIWVGFSVYIPPTWPDTVALKVMSSQIYAVNSDPALRGPTNFAFNIQSPAGKLQWYLSHGTNLGVDVVKGKWTDFVFYLDMKKNGWATVWVDGNKVFDSARDMTGPTPEPSIGAPIYLNIGAYTGYDWETPEDPSDALVTYFDDIRVGDANSSYRDVAP